MWFIDEQRQSKRRSQLSVLLIFSVLAPAPAPCESHYGVEVKPFGTLDTDARFSVRYLLDDRERFTDSSPTGFEDRSTLEQELVFSSENYVYHPGFLNMEFAGGPLLVQQRFDSFTGGFRENDTLLNFLARFNFLDLKSYPFSLYYEQSHPSITTSLSGRFLTKNNEYGFSGSSSGLLPSTQLSVAASRRDAEGSGLGTVLDESVDRAVFGWVTSYRDEDQISIEYNRFDQDSRSGSSGLPIVESMTDQRTLNVRAHNAFGNRRQFVVDQTLLRLEQEMIAGIPSEFENRNYRMAARWQNSDTFRSQFNYRYFETVRADADGESHDVGLSFNHDLSDTTRYGLNANHQTEEQVGFNRDRTRAGGTLNYVRETGFGSISLGATVRQERNDQESIADAIQVFDEPVTLTGTTPVDLVNEFIVAPTIIVTNSTGSQIFVENLDYRLIVVGSVTSIQRLIDGNISDEQTVLIDYEYRTGGTAKFDRFSTGVTASIDFLEYLNIMARYQLSDSSLVDGQLTTPINDFNLYEISLTADVPIGHRLTIGGEVRHLDNDETIAPFIRDSVMFNMSSRINGSLRLFASAGLVRVDQEASIEDVDQVTYRAGITGRAFGRMQLTYQAAYLEDTGGSLIREQLEHRINLQAVYRQVRFVLRAQYFDVTQGVTERNDMQVTAEVTRVF